MSDVMTITLGHRGYPQSIKYSDIEEWEITDKFIVLTRKTGMVEMFNIMHVISITTHLSEPT